LLPAFEKVWFVRIKDAGGFGRCASFREGLRSDEATNGLPTDLDSPRDFTQTEALLLECSNGEIREHTDCAILSVLGPV
jgi:hypothetical protein